MRWSSMSLEPRQSSYLAGLMSAAFWLFSATIQMSFAQSHEQVSSEPPQQILNRSLKQLRLRNFDNAVNGFSEAIRRDDKNALAWFGRALARFQAAKKRLDDSTATPEETDALEEDCLMALRLNPDVYTSYRRWAGDPADAELKAIQERIEIFSSFEMVLGMSQLVKNEFEQAFRSFDRSVDLMPADAHRLYTRGFFHKEQGHYDTAIRDFDRVVQMHQSNPTNDTTGQLGLTLDARGVAWREKGNYQRALADATEAMRLMPNVGMPIMNRGIAHFRNNNVNQALSDLNEAIRLDPTLAMAWYQRGVIFGLRGDNAKSLSDLNEAVRLNPRHAESHFVRGMVLVKMEKPEEAMAAFTSAIELAPVFPAAWFNRGLLRFGTSDFRGAIEDLTQFINLAAVVGISSDELAMAYAHRADAYEKVGESELAKADRSRSQELTGVSVPDPMEALIGDLDNADPGAQITAARALREIADVRAVEPLCRRLKAAMEITSADPSLIFHLEQAILEINDPNAIDTLIAQQQSDSRLVPVVLDSLAKFEESRAVDTIALRWERVSMTDNHQLSAVIECIIRDRIRGPRAREVLMHRLQKGDSAAAAALRRFPDSEVVRVLITALNDSQAAVRRTAADSLGSIGNPQASSSLLALLNDPDMAVRRHTARALGDLQEPRAVAPLLELLSSESEEGLLSDIAYALGQVGDPTALPPLQAKLATSESLWLRKNLEAAIVRLRE